MSNSYTTARKKALNHLGLDERSALSYTYIAKRLVFKEGAVVEGLNLNEKHGARELIRTWASLTEYRKHNGTI